jgi:hypothetical protein
MYWKRLAVTSTTPPTPPCPPSPAKQSEIENYARYSDPLLPQPCSPGTRTIVQRAIDRGELPTITDIDLLLLPLALLQHQQSTSVHRTGTDVADRIVDQFYRYPAAAHPPPG